MTGAAIMLGALLLDIAFGWPRAIFERIGHPVTWIGALIARLDGAWNRERGARLAGVACTALVILAATLPAVLIQAVLPGGLLELLILAALAWPLVAARSLHEHVARVAVPLAAGDLVTARQEVAQIVGRDVSAADRPAIARAALESLAENSSDGVVAPLFWGLVLGLPGLAAYKAINTLDSMIGHRTARHHAFGWFAARLDDLVNWIPARMTGALFALISGRAAAWTVLWRDARLHRSPNAGWPEAAMAGGLNLRLSGPRIYADHVAEEPWVNAAGRDPGPEDLRRGLQLYRRLVATLAVGLAGLALL